MWRPRCILHAIGRLPAFGLKARAGAYGGIHRHFGVARPNRHSQKRESHLHFLRFLSIGFALLEALVKWSGELHPTLAVRLDGALSIVAFAEE